MCGGALDRVWPAARHTAIDVQLGERPRQRGGIAGEDRRPEVARRLGVATPRGALA